ncbi:endoglucanase 4-like [Pecten maximus]|uniref:endoglucanase 4-like n=1 Tax=Pecten maximus TaxID=6579 RepID=UPI001458558D|nr:endoglucanase 4-like [Pecten maximus]
MRYLVLVLLYIVVVDCAVQRVAINRESVWKPNKKKDNTLKRVQCSCTFTLDKEYKVGTWEVNITVNKPTEKLKIWIMKVENRADDGSWYACKNKHEYQEQEIKVSFQLDFRGKKPRGECVSNLPEVVTTTEVYTTTLTPTEPVTSGTTASSTFQTTTEAITTNVAVSTTEDTTQGGSVPITIENNHVWASEMKGVCLFKLDQTLVDFELLITFSKATFDLQVWVGEVKEQDPNGKWYNLKNHWPQHPPQMKVEFLIKFQGTAPTGTCTLNENNGGLTTTLAPVTTKLTQGPVTTKPTDVPVTTKPTDVPVTTKATHKPVTTEQTEAPATTEQTEAPVTTKQTEAPVTTKQTEAPATTEQTQSPTTETTSSAKLSTVDPSVLNTKYDYKKVLELSILFYEAQRSGKLPASNRIPYRGDSALTDAAPDGSSLAGGWYDAGDGVKFNLPMAASTTLLAWGLTMFEDAYSVAGQQNLIRDSIKWPLDYFLKCWKPDTKTYYAQVGNGDTDHAYWGRHEDMIMNRPAYKVDTNSPGSDVAADTAAALTAGYLAFKTTDQAYADTLLDAAKSLYAFADQYRGVYSDSIPNAGKFYRSYSGYKDELCYAAALLYKATGDNSYLTDAKQVVDLGMAYAQDWDNKMTACQVMLYEAVPQNEKSQYAASVKEFLKAYMPGGSVGHTPDGLAWRAQWGSLRYAANAAFIGVAAAYMGIGDVQSYIGFAEKQINYALGDNMNQISYVVGFGNKYPLQPHHRASSCPDHPAPCGWNEFNLDAPNPQILYGALVGGPNKLGVYTDRRNDYITNEVTCDYNAGFQSAVAGLIHFALKNQL